MALRNKGNPCSIARACLIDSEAHPPFRVFHFCRLLKDPCVTWKTVTSFQTFVELATCVRQILLRVQASGGLVFRR